jgi:hypothetical protein
MAQTPGPGSCDAGSDQDRDINDRETAAPRGAGEISSDQDDLERPSPRAVLVIALQRMDEATFGRPAE